MASRKGKTARDVLRSVCDVKDRVHVYSARTPTSQGTLKLIYIKARENFSATCKNDFLVFHRGIVMCSSFICGSFIFLQTFY